MTGALHGSPHIQITPFTAWPFHRDGQRLAIRGINRWTFDGEVHLLDTARWSEIITIRHKLVDPFFDVQAIFSRYGRWLATAGNDEVVNFINAMSGRQVAVFRQEAMVQQIGFLEQGKRLFSVAVGGDIKSVAYRPRRPPDSLPAINLLAILPVMSGSNICQDNSTGRHVLTCHADAWP